MRERSGASYGPALAGIAIGTAAAVVALVLVLPTLRRPRPSTGSTPAATALRTESAPPPAAAKVDLAQLRSVLVAEAARIPGSVSVHVRLENGGRAGVKGDEARPAASLIKLPIMVVLQDAWARGLLKRTARDEEAVRKAITLSDNPSADWLISRLGTSQINEWLTEHGYKQTRLKHRMEGPRPDGPNAVSAQEMTRMLLEIAGGKLISAEASAGMRGLLLAQTRRTRLPAELPEGVTVGNKTGTLRGIVNDAAFVEPPGGPRYAIAVLVTRARSDDATSRAIARLSRRVYEVITHPEPKL